MTPPYFTELPYHEDTAALFESIADEPWAVFLDNGGRDRYDIVCAGPFATLTAQGDDVTVHDAEGTRVVAGPALDAVRVLLGPRAPAGELPFSGGVLGYFGYGLGSRLMGLPVREAPTPEMCAGVYDWALVVDHACRRTVLAGQGRDPRTPTLWSALVERFSAPHPARTRLPLVAMGPLEIDLDREAYGRAFDRVQNYIHEGDCYQVNLARRFRISCAGDAWAGFRRLRALSPAPFGAYLNLPGFQVLSVSPERFLHVHDGSVETKPIKGTRPRSDDPMRDAALADELRASQKDRAENLMIVDLLRNDIGKCCATGSVSVPRMFDIESYATVHHLVSTVSGTLAPGRNAIDLLEACLPGGSITGAPKRRAMEIIEELEPCAREMYCGAIGYVGFDGTMDTNVAIRTLVHQDGEARFWAGGGIVADSDCDAEFQETLDKARAMLQLFSR